jgi:isoleucyl-tRNA synthetase
MALAQKLSSMILGLRRKVSIKVRQPLNKMMLPILDPSFKEQVEKVKNLVLNEVNVKEIEYISDTSGILVKKVKPNFKSLGPRYGKLMKEIGQAIGKLEQEEIIAFERQQSYVIDAGGQKITLGMDDVEIISEDIPGWLVANEGALTIALDIHITEELKHEGTARELINRIQNIRKESGFDVTDKIEVYFERHPLVEDAIKIHGDYIGSQTLANKIQLVEKLDEADSKTMEIDDGETIVIRIERV